MMPSNADKVIIAEVLSLPLGHGLVAGEITVPPGGSDEYGNVVVSCPSGGSPCTVSVAADGTATYDRTGGVPSVGAAFESWNLPLGHGLVAGEITVLPGGSDEYGNVVVSCPSGGSPCTVSVAADGTATYDRTGGVPYLTAVLANPSLVTERSPKSIRSGSAGSLERTGAVASGNRPDNGRSDKY